MSNVLVFADPHEPFSHRRSFEFLDAVADRFQCNSFICLGDLLDHHRISRHTTEPDGMGAVAEMNKAIKRIIRWGELFPKMDIILGNHDLIPKRQAKEVGLPSSFLRDLKDVYQMPKGWKFHNRLVKDNVLYLHSAGSGKYGAINKAKEMSMSVVAGHTHRHGGVLYFSNPSQQFFGLQCGCLVDKKAYAMRYSDVEVSLGCGVIDNGREALYVPMAMGKDLKKYKRLKNDKKKSK